MLGRFPVALRLSRCLLRGSSGRRVLSAMAGGDGEGQLGDFFEYMERLRNYERSGVPRGAGTDSDDGFDLGRMRRLLRRLGDPHTHFPAVHIAGTKGKGSTAAFLSNIMREQGYNVGCYSSPHLLTIRERISVGNDGGPVPVGLLSDLFDQAKEAIDESIELENGALTHFEVFTALSFLLFSQENVDIAIVEAGLGGARDATNVIQSTELAASVITTVGREHLAALGGSLQNIAIAKSGIIKQGRPVCNSLIIFLLHVYQDQVAPVYHLPHSQLESLALFLLELNGGMTSLALLLFHRIVGILFLTLFSNMRKMLPYS